MNKTFLIGNLTKNPELRTTQTGKSVASASIATNKSYIDQAGQKQTVVQFHNLVLWGKPAETFVKYLTKGKKVAIVGEMQTRNYQAQDGTKRYVTEVLVNEFEFLSPAEKKPEMQDQNQGWTPNDIPVDNSVDNTQAPDDGGINVNDIPF
ncbi:MAG: Single-stranded DNA-binding protein [Candidatus Moranbacteria bacterium GW2011_GWD2_36_12]|nr:MAG: Single-stranded DNA-binding protein [Candidatus Moranbacteria bacterium GW2011_GWD2_36_12]